MSASLAEASNTSLLQEGHARGWPIWKALITSAQLRGTDPRKAKKARQSICDILDDHSQAQQNE
jgi:hypothetical protein